MKSKKILLLLPFFLISCEKKENQIKKTTFTKTTFLQHIYDSIIQPLHIEFDKESKKLKSRTEFYNLNVNLENLKKVKNSLDTLFKLKNSSYIFNTQEIRNTFIHFKIGSTPCDTSFVSDKIITQTSLTQNEINFHSGSRKGLGVIDFIAYGKNKLLQTQNNHNYASHLDSYAENIKINVFELLQAWKNNEKKYKTSIKTSVDGSYNQLINGIKNSLEVIRIKKLKISLNTSNSQYSETPYSLKNIAIIRSELQMIKKIFTGNNGSFIGIKDNLIDLDKNELSNNIQEKLDEAISKCQTIEHITFDELLINNKNQINELIEVLADLIIYFKSDVSSLLGIIITPGDVDGD